MTPREELLRDHQSISMHKIVVLIWLIAAVAGEFQGHGDEQGHEQHEVHDYHAPPHYKFKYSVHDSKTHDKKEQEEEREDDRVKGYYSLEDADGTTRQVHYTSDKVLGFKAYVTRSGHAYHPAKYGSSSLSFHEEHEGGHGGAEEGHHGGAMSSSSFSGHY